MVEKHNLLLSDKGLILINDIEKMIMIENNKQINKWGYQTHNSGNWLKIINEEMGEVNKAIMEYEYRKGTLEAIIYELIQTTTLLLKLTEMYLIQLSLKEGNYHINFIMGDDI